MGGVLIRHACQLQKFSLGRRNNCLVDRLQRERGDDSLRQVAVCM